jgi:hypothetical protein
LKACLLSAIQTKSDELHSNFAFNFNLRRYTVVISLALSAYLTCALVAMPDNPGRQELVCWAGAYTRPLFGSP